MSEHHYDVGQVVTLCDTKEDNITGENRSEWRKVKQGKDIRILANEFSQNFHRTVWLKSFCLSFPHSKSLDNGLEEMYDIEISEIANASSHFWPCK